MKRKRQFRETRVASRGPELLDSLESRRRHGRPVAPAALARHYLEISRLLAGQLDFRSALQAVAAEVAHILPHDHLDVCLLTNDGKYHSAYEIGFQTAWSEMKAAPVTRSPIRSLLRGEVDFLLTDDACSDPRFDFPGAIRQPIIEQSLRSRINVPMKVQGEIIGAFSCSSQEIGIYRPEDVVHARAVADLLSPYFFALEAAARAQRSAIVEAEARAREEGLRLGALKLTEALEQERQRIGMDLHDQTLADLTRLSRRVDSLARAGELAADAREELSRDLQHCMQDLRNIIEQARPSVLQLFGLSQALENHLERATRDSGVPIAWTLRDDTGGSWAELDEKVSVALFRIAQEAINNAVRHAAPSRISVRLFHQECFLALEVSDDGSGFAGEAHKPASGIDNMKTRAQLISARLVITPSMGVKGTRVLLLLPWPQRPSSQEDST
jgi:signal transduction histidine kinase